MPFIPRPSRQVAATIAMVVLTVAPTIYVAETAWRINRPGHRHEVESQIGRVLGLEVTLDAVRYPRPGEVLYRGVLLRQEEPSRRGLAEVARADSVRLRRGGSEWTLEVDGLALRAESPRAAMVQVAALLQRLGAGGERVTVSAPACTLDLGAGVAPYRLREVVGTFQADPAAPGIRASYRVVDEGSKSSTRCELALTRDRKAEPVRTTLALRTMEGLPLPARVLGPFFDADGWLGPEARVEGALTLRQDGAKDWEAEFRGSFFDIDLADLVGRRFPTHRLKGRARLAVSSARWAERPGQGYGWVEAAGELDAGPGAIGVGLLQALSAEMNFRKGPRVDRVASADPDLDFHALAIKFAMSGDGEIRIKGGLGSEYADDVVLAGASSPLAYAPEGVANVRGLIKTLFPVATADRGVMVPLTEKSRLLLCLPVPPDLAAKARPIGGN